MLLNNSCLIAYAGRTQSFQPKFDKHTFLLSVLLWAICQRGMVPSLDWQDAEIRPPRKVQGQCRHQRGLGLGAGSSESEIARAQAVQPCRYKNLVLKARTWPPHLGQSPDGAPLNREIITKCYKAMLFSHVRTSELPGDPVQKQISIQWAWAGA